MDILGSISLFSLKETGLLHMRWRSIRSSVFTSRSDRFGAIWTQVHVKPGFITPNSCLGGYHLYMRWNDYWRSTPLIVINHGIAKSGLDIRGRPWWSAPPGPSDHLFHRWKRASWNVPWSSLIYKCLAAHIDLLEDEKIPLAIKTIHV